MHILIKLDFTIFLSNAFNFELSSNTNHLYPSCHDYTIIASVFQTLLLSVQTIFLFFSDMTSDSLVYYLLSTTVQYCITYLECRKYTHHSRLEKCCHTKEILSNQVHKVVCWVTRYLR